MPPVARASKPFQFIFSASTFTSITPTINYVLSNSPAWLQLDSNSRTLYGTPGPKDAGPATFTITATDSTGSTPLSVTLIVSTNQGPGLGTSLTQQLSALGAFSFPDSLLFYPSTPISLSFGSDTFTDTDGNTVYYALCANNTPLPSWLNFDASSLSFSGTTPDFTSPGELPQAFAIELSASDVVGFSAATVSFQIIIGDHEFTFGNKSMVIDVIPGKHVNFSGISDELTLDGVPIQIKNLKEILPETPDWMSIDAQTLILSGMPPDSVTSQNFSVLASDIYGDTANTTIFISVDSSSDLIQGDIGALHAVIGSEFSYTFNRSLFPDPAAKISVDLGNTTLWLRYDPSQLILQGTVPGNLSPQLDRLNVTVSKGARSQTQVFTILLAQSDGLNGNIPTNASSGIATTSQTSSSSPTTSATPMRNTAGGSHSRTVAVALMVPLTLIAAIFLGCCIRRKRQNKTFEGDVDTWRRYISRLILQDHFMHREYDEKEQGFNYPPRGHKRLPSEPPKLEVLGKRESWQRSLRRFTAVPMMISGAIRPNSIAPVDDEIPLRKPEVTRISRGQPRSSNRYSRLSIARDTSYRGKRLSAMSLSSRSVVISRRISGIGHGGGMHGTSLPEAHSRQSEQNSLISSSRGFGHGKCGFENQYGGPPGHGRIAKSWRNIQSAQSDECGWTTTSGTMTSSINPSSIRNDNEATNQSSTIQSFPRPHTKQTPFTSDTIYADTMRTIQNNKPTIRTVMSSSRSRSDFSSYLKRRSRNRHNPLFSAGPSSRRTSQIAQKRSNMKLRVESAKTGQTNITPDPGKHQPAFVRSYSASSSLHPPIIPLPRNPRIHKSSIPSLRRFNLLRLRPSKSSLASSQRFESANESEGQSDIDECDGDLLEEETERTWAHAVLPDPLRVHATEPDLDERRGNKVQRSSWLRALGGSGATRTRVVLGDKERRPISVENEAELRRDRPGSASVRGELAFV